MKKLIYLALCVQASYILASGQGYSHPKTNLFWFEKAPSKSQLATVQTVCIIAPNTPQPLDAKTYSCLKKFSQTLAIPCLYVNWVDKAEGITNLRNEAETFALSLKQLTKDLPVNTSVMLIGLGRAGRLINAATQVMGFPQVDSIIQIGTPIPAASQKLNPKPGTFKFLFNFQTSLPYSFQNPLTLESQDDLKEYTATKTFKPYNIRLIIDGKQLSLQKDVFAPPFKKTFQTLGSQLFALCQDAKTNFTTYRTLWASLDTKQPQKTYVGMLKKKNYKVTPTSQEFAQDALARAAFQKTYGPLKKALAVQDGKKFRSTYRTAKTNNRTLQKLSSQTA